VITVVLFGVEYAMTIEAYQWFVSGVVALWWLLAAGLAYELGRPQCGDSGENGSTCGLGPVLTGG
jgi:hypothetical protein